MKLRQIFRISIRYAFGFRNGYLSPFLSTLSTLALILAVCLLTIVLSIMNGFEKEMRERILWFIPHIVAHEVIKSDKLSALQEEISNHPEAVEVEYFKTVDALILHKKNVETTSILAFDFNDAQEAPRLIRFLSSNDLSKNDFSGDGFVIGRSLADRLGVAVGDEVTFLVPKVARKLHDAISMRLSVEAILSTGTQIDEFLIIQSINGLSAHVPKEAIESGFHIYIKDIFDASRIARELEETLKPSAVFVKTWVDTHGNLYSAIQLSKDLVGILLFSIIAIAAFNIIASLVLMVMDKRAGIAILRTMGASSAEVGQVFIIIGLLIGIVGVVIGSILGMVLSYSLPSIVEALEALIGTTFLNTDVYPINFVPVHMVPLDLVIVGTSALLMCILATIYPAISASRIQPASALKSHVT